MNASFATPHASDAHEAERIEALAWEDLAAAVASLSPRSRTRAALCALRDENALALMSPLPVGLFNRVIGLGTLTRASPEQLERVIDLYVPGSSPIIHLGESLDHSWLCGALSGRGFALHPRRWIKLVRGQGAVRAARTALEIEKATGRDHEEAGAVLAQSFGFPGDASQVFASIAHRPHWHLLVARDAGRVVAAASLFVRGASGYLLAAATLTSHRGRGAQAALIERRLRIAFALGCTRVFAETGEAIEGRPQSSGDNLLRAGFRPLALRENWARSAPHS